MRTLLTIASLLFGSSVFAVTIDFEDVVGFPEYIIESGGFRFEAPSEGLSPIFMQSLDGWQEDGYNAGLGFAFQSHAVITMSSIDGSNFGLSSFDIGEIFIGDIVATLVTGYLDGGGTVELLVEDIGINDVMNVQFDSSWNNLVAVEFFPPPIPATNGIIVMDNIVVSAAVPIPAAAWLFVSGLAALGFVRRGTQAP